MRKMLAFAGVAVMVLTASTAFAEVKVSMQDGRVSIVAKDATLRQILTEWASVGQTKIVNVERIPGGPMTIELTNMPEQQALDLLLRSVSGYMTAPRPVADAHLSQFDRVVVMPTSVAPRAAVTAQPAPTFAQPQFTPPPQMADDDVDDERPAPNVAAPNGLPNPRGPIFNTFPQPQVVTPGANGAVGGVPQPQFPPQPQSPPQQRLPPQQQQPAAQPTAPFGGVAVPGMTVPPPQQPGQVPGQVPAVPGQPQPRLPGGPEGQ
jgi:hypothetical protein